MKLRIPLGAALLALPLLGHAQGQPTVSARNASLAQNFAIAPKLPPAPKPEPFKVTTIPLPAEVEDAVLINYLPDQKHLIMEVTVAGATKSNLAVMQDDGTGYKCLTCDLKENIGGEMPVPLPDGKRVYTPRGVLECSPSIVDCKEAKILPIVWPTIPGARELMRIATNMSPDGVHVAYTLIVTRPMPSLVLASELTRVADAKGERYEMLKTKVLAGSESTIPGADPLRPVPFSAGEVKSFADGGRSLITISSFEAGNFDLSKLDLTTGVISRFTRHYSYDEGTYPSPDGKWVIFQSHRHTNRMDAFSLVPRPSIAAGATIAGIAEYRNETVPGFRDARRYYGLTMVDQYGDRARMPEDGYTGQNLLTAPDNLTEYNHYGNLSWHASSTYGVFWEQRDPRKVKKGEQLGRLRMIRFPERKPTTPLKPFNPEMKWAPYLADLQPMAPGKPAEGTLKGRVSGYAKISQVPPAVGTTDDPVTKIEYVNFSDDGVTILNGSESNSAPAKGVGFSFNSTWNADIAVTGKRKGYLKVENAHFRARMDRGSGTIKAALGEHKVEVDLAKGLPTGVPGEAR